MAQGTQPPTPKYLLGVGQVKNYLILTELNIKTKIKLLSNLNSRLRTPDHNLISKGTIKK